MVCGKVVELMAFQRTVKVDAAIHQHIIQWYSIGPSVTIDR